MVRAAPGCANNDAMIRRLSACFIPAVAAALAVGTLAPASAADRWSTLPGFDAPGTPAKYDKVKVLKQGPAKADNILVLIPGTSAGASNFRLVARAILARTPGWQVWSIERRENLLEDNSVLNRYVAGKATGSQLVDYYLNWITDPSISPRFTPKTTAETTFARQWGMNVAVHDVRRVVKSAARGGRTVVLGGHSLGGRMTAAYATWNFGGKPGVKDLAGLVYIDGGGASRELPTAEEARADRRTIDTGSPWLDLLQLGLPWASGVFNALGSTTAVQEPNRRSLLQPLPLVPGSLKPPVPATNVAQYGYSVNVGTSPEFLALVQSHVGRLASSGDPRGWVNGGLGSARRAAKVFAEKDGVDGTSWYHPARLSLDGQTVNNGIANPAQRVLGVKSVFGKRVRVPQYAFDAALGSGRVGRSARQLARQSGMPRSSVTVVDRSRTYAHIDPLSAKPSLNAFVKTVSPFLAGIGEPVPTARGRG